MAEWFLHGKEDVLSNHLLKNYVKEILTLSQIFQISKIAQEQYLEQLNFIDQRGVYFEQVLHSLIHMHVNRYLGDNLIEKKIRHYTFRTLLTLQRNKMRMETLK